MMIKARTLERVVHVARNDFLEEYTFFVLFISFRGWLKVLRSALDKLRLPYMRRRFETK